MAVAWFYRDPVCDHRATMAKRHTIIAAKGMDAAEKGGSRAGMSLVETLVALGIFALFITGSVKLLMAHRELGDMARAHYTAINIAKNRMEVMRTLGFGQADDFLEEKMLVDASGLPDAEGGYRRTTQISAVSSNLVEIAITVEIRDRKTLGFKGRNEHLTTYFADYLTEDSSVGGGVAPNSA